MQSSIKTLSVALISVFITYLLGEYKYSVENEIKKIDIYKKFNANFLSKPKFPNADIKLTIDGIEKSKLGLFEISLLNYSNNNFDDIPIHIKITPENNDDFKLLTYYAVGEKNIPNLVNELKPMVFDGKSYLFSYQVTTLNRAEKDDTGITLNILFEGNKEPKIDVVAKGINTQEFSWEHSPYQKDITQKVVIFIVTSILILIILLIFIIGPVMSILTRPLDRKSDSRYAQEILLAITENNLLPNSNELEKKQFVQRMLYFQKLNTWNSKTKLDKWVAGMIEPKIENFKIE